MHRIVKVATNYIWFGGGTNGRFLILLGFELRFAGDKIDFCHRKPILVALTFFLLPVTRDCLTSRNYAKDYRKLSTKYVDVEKHIFIE